MSKKVIFLILLLVCGVFATLEFLISPPQTSSLNKNNENIEQEAGNKSIPYLKGFKISDFSTVEFADLSIEELKFADTLFKSVSLATLNEEFSASSALIKSEGDTVVKITEFHAKKNITSAKLFEMIKSHLYENIPEDDKNTIIINQTDSFGEHSFYFNNKKNHPGMVFLVVKGHNKVMAFEYQEEDHDKISLAINNIFKNEIDFL